MVFKISSVAYLIFYHMIEIAVFFCSITRSLSFSPWWIFSCVNLSLVARSPFPFEFFNWLKFNDGNFTGGLISSDWVHHQSQQLIIAIISHTQSIQSHNIHYTLSLYFFVFISFCNTVFVLNLFYLFFIGARFYIHFLQWKRTFQFFALNLNYICRCNYARA